MIRCFPRNLSDAETLEEFLTIVLEAGRSAVELALYVLLPIMVVMMAVMKLLEAKGVLAFAARLLSPPLRVFGIPGLGAFAMLQLLLVSFAAPVATLAIMERDGTSKRRIAATVAMILAMSQANAVFPMLAVGLSFPITLLTSLVGGLVAAAVTFYFLLRREDPESAPEQSATAVASRRSSSLESLLRGGRKGLQLALHSIPALVLAITLVKLLEARGAISLLQRALSPVLEMVGLAGEAVLPVVTKYLAGGTAMMGVAMNLVREDAMTPNELNRIAGFMINPFDLVGVSVLLTAGPRVKAVKLPAMLGAVVGIMVRGVLHLALF